MPDTNPIQCTSQVHSLFLLWKHIFLQLLLTLCSTIQFKQRVVESFQWTVAPYIGMIPKRWLWNSPNLVALREKQLISFVTARLTLHLLKVIWIYCIWFHLVFQNHLPSTSSGQPHNVRSHCRHYSIHRFPPLHIVAHHTCDALFRFSLFQFHIILPLYFSISIYLKICKNARHFTSFPSFFSEFLSVTFPSLRWKQSVSAFSPLRQILF